MKNKIITPQELAETKGKIVVKMTACWCGACSAIQPAFEKYTVLYPELGVFEMDADTNSAYVMGIGIQRLPSFASFIDGKVHQIGVGLDALTLKKWLETL